MTRILVTGASGFIGRPLVQRLLRAGYSVRATTRGAAPLPQGVEVAIIPDLLHAIDWEPLLRGVDLVIHLAGLAHADNKSTDIRAFDTINRRATEQLAQAARRAEVERFIFISSVRAQVGASASQIIHEDDEALPTNKYGRSKLAAESAVRASGVPFTILRPVAIYGPQPRGNIKTLTRLASASYPLPFLGLDSRRSLLGIENFISAVLFALNEPATLGEIFLVADRGSMTVGQIFATLREAQSRSPRLIHVPPLFLRLILLLLNRGYLWERISGDLVVDTSKLQALGWHPNVDTHQGLVAMMQSERPPGI